MKPRYKRRIFWSILTVIVACVLAIVIVPPFISLDKMKPQIEAAVKNQTGIDIKINGVVNFSMLGRVRIMAHDIVVPSYDNGIIRSVEFDIPLVKLFNPETAELSDTLSIYGADFNLRSLEAPKIDKKIILYDSSVRFMGKTYSGISGTLLDGMFTGTLRTDQHKYNFNASDNQFHISNQAQGLDIIGQSMVDNNGNMSAAGTLSISTPDVNRFFEFDVPRIPGPVAMEMKFEWRGEWFKFSDIKGTWAGGTFAGDITFDPEHKSIMIRGNNIDFDLAFLTKYPAWLQNSEFNVDLAGNLRFMGMEFDRIRLETSADSNEINVDNLEFYSPDMSGVMFGTINSDGASLFAKLVRQNETVTCAFVGTPVNWSCKNWTYSSAQFSANGALKMTPESFDITFYSDDLAGDISDIANLQNYFLRNRGTARFQLEDGVTGVATFDGKNNEIKYFNKRNAALGTLVADGGVLSILPGSMLRTSGTFQSVYVKNSIPVAFDFSGATGDTRWTASMTEKGNFKIEHNLALFLGEYYPNINLGFLNQALPIEITGRYKKPYISDIVINIAGSTPITGKFDGRILDLRTDLFDLDLLLNPDYINNYESQQFLMPEPLFAPFSVSLPVVFSADYIKYDAREYENFVYSLKKDSQSMSVTDAARGDVLLSVERSSRNKYDITLQVNKFVLSGNVLADNAPLNLRDTTLTAQAELSTFGITSHDVWRNLAGDVEMTFDGGELFGIGIDQLYDSLPNLSRIDQSDALAAMMSGGTTRIQGMHINGYYDNGRFETTRPFVIGASRARIVGDIISEGGKIQVAMNMTLRGTSPDPRPFALTVTSSGGRVYSISDMLVNFDLDYMQHIVGNSN